MAQRRMGLAQQETERVKNQVEWVMREAEEAKREATRAAKVKDAEIFQLQQILAQNGIRGPIQRDYY